MWRQVYQRSYTPVRLSSEDIRYAGTTTENTLNPAVLISGNIHYWRIEETYDIYNIAAQTRRQVSIQGSDVERLVSTGSVMWGLNSNNRFRELALVGGGLLPNIQRQFFVPDAVAAVWNGSRILVLTATTGTWRLQAYTTSGATSGSRRTLTLPSDLSSSFRSRPTAIGIVGSYVVIAATSSGSFQTVTFLNNSTYTPRPQFNIPSTSTGGGTAHSIISTSTRLYVCTGRHARAFRHPA